MSFPISESEILKSEQKIGIRFPDSFRKAMMSENGGCVMAREMEWEIYPFFDTSDRKRLARTANDILRETVQVRNWEGFPEGGWAIANNGYGDILFFKRAPNDENIFENTVYAFWHETRNIETIAKDFSDLSKE